MDQGPELVSPTTPTVQTCREGNGIYWRKTFYMYTINPEPECLPADKNAEGVVKPEPQARVLPRPRHFYPPVNTRCEGFIMLIIYSFLYFKEETNAFHYQKVAIFLYRKSVERECRWKGEERNQALFQNLNSETCKQNLQQRWLPANNTRVVARNLDPLGCFQAFLERSKEPRNQSGVISVFYHWRKVIGLESSRNLASTMRRRRSWNNLLKLLSPLTQRKPRLSE